MGRRIVRPPRLLITADKLRQIREEPDEVQREMLEAMRGQPVNHPAPPVQTMVHDGLLYLLFDDTAAAQRAVDTVREVLSTEDSSVIGDGLGTARLGMAFDLLQGHLSAPEQAAVRREIVDGIVDCATRHTAWFDARWQEVYHGQVSLDNHMTRGSYALVSVGLALRDEVPQAEAWLAQGTAFLRRTLRAYPPDGSDIYAGSWFTLHYASVLMPMLFLRHAGLDLFQGQPALANHVRYRQYCAVGDLLDHIAFNGDSHTHKVVGDSYLLYVLASAYHDGHAQWLAHRMRALSRDPAKIRGALPLYEGPPAEAFELACYDPAVRPVSGLAGLPPAALFPDTGEAILRGGWGPDEPVLWFCCAPVGGIYRHPDVSPIRWHAQPTAGSFQIYAGGSFLTEEPNPSTTRRTCLGNTVTVGGVGQLGEEVGHEIRIAMLAPGEAGTADVRCFHHGPGYDVVQGEAWRAYRPEAGLTGYTRTIVYIRPGFYVVHDQLRARTPSRYEWRLHTAGEVVPLADRPAARTHPHLFRRGEGGLAVDVVLPTDAVTEVVPSAYFPGYSGSFGRYRHLLVTPAEPTEAATFLTLLRPVGRGTPLADCQVQAVGAEAVQGLALEHGAGRDILLFAEDSVRVSVEGVEMNAHGCAVGCSYQGVPRRYLLWGGTSLSCGGFQLFAADRPVEAASFRVEDSEWSGLVRAAQDTTLDLPVPQDAEVRVDDVVTEPLRREPDRAVFALPAGEHRVRAVGRARQPQVVRVPVTTSVWPGQRRAVLEVGPNPFRPGQELLLSTASGSAKGWPVSARYFCGLRAPDKDSFEVVRLGRAVSPGRLELADGLLFYPAYTTENGTYLTDNLVPDGDMSANGVTSWFCSPEPGFVVEKVTGRSSRSGTCLRAGSTAVAAGGAASWAEQEIFGLEPGGTYRLAFSTCVVQGQACVEYHDAAQPTRVPLAAGRWACHAVEFRFTVHDDGTAWGGTGRARDSFLFRCRLEPQSELLLDAVTLQRR